MSPTAKVMTPCPFCAAKLPVPVTAAGKKVRCPKCQSVFSVAPLEAKDLDRNSSNHQTISTPRTASAFSSPEVQKEEDRQQREQTQKAKINAALQKSQQLQKDGQFEEAVQLLRRIPPHLQTDSIREAIEELADFWQLRPSVIQDSIGIPAETNQRIQSPSVSYDNPYQTPTTLPPRQSVGSRNHPGSRPAQSQLGLLQASEGMDLATPGQRFRARIMDYLTGFLVLLISTPPMLMAQGSNTGIFGITVIWYIGCCVLWLSCYVGLLCRGKTPGKYIVGIHVVDLETGQPAGFLRTGLIREFLVGIIYCIPLVGLIFQIAEIVMLFQPERRTPRDLIANTSVVRD